MTLIKNNVKTVNPTEDLLKAPYGQQGATIITDQTVYNGDWYCVVALTDNTELDAGGTIVNWTQNATSTLTNDVPMIAGVPMYGDLKAIQLVAANCTVIAYYK